MTEAAHLLKLIENVNPEDSAALDEIDARATAYVLGQTFIGFTNWHDFEQGDFVRTKENGWITRLQLSTSRDALKQIRPEGWWFDTSQYGKWYHSVARWSGNPDDVFFTSAGRMTGGKSNKNEELAELYAIIQAIAHDRTTKEGGIKK